MMVGKRLEDLYEVAQYLVDQASDYTIWVLEGEMGAGKTTLIKAICQVLGVIDSVSSPTFSIVNQYLTKHHQEIYHFDFYRIKNEQEALDIGVEDYFYSGNRCLIEWASLIPTLLPERYAKINIEIDQDKHRNFHLEFYE